jgi:hypothetical protein
VACWSPYHRVINLLNRLAMGLGHRVRGPVQSTWALGARSGWRTAARVAH